MHIFENYFIKAIEQFPSVYIALSKHLEGWENSIIIVVVVHNVHLVEYMLYTRLKG